MRKRWGWQPVPYGELSPFLKPMVQYLINVPSLTEEGITPFYLIPDDC